MSGLPPLNALRAFEASGRHLTFRGAAEELRVTQGAVAQHVRALEAELAMPLFDRLPKGLAFTVVGRRYHARIAEAFAEMREATVALRPEPQKVVVSVTPTFAARWLIPRLPNFADRHPDIDLQILATERVSRIQGDGVDLAVRHGSPSIGATLEARKIFSTDVIAVASPQIARVVAQDGLGEVPKLHDAHDLWPDYLKHAGIADTAGGGLRLSQTTLAIEAALSGQGAALVNRFLVDAEIAAGRLCQVHPFVLGGTQDFYLLARRAKDRSAAVGAVFDWIIAAAMSPDRPAN